MPTFEYVPKNPGHKMCLYIGNKEFVLYVGTNTHRWFKLYYFPFGGKERSELYQKIRDRENGHQDS